MSRNSLGHEFQHLNLVNETPVNTSGIDFAKKYLQKNNSKYQMHSNQPISSILSVHNGSGYILHTENDSLENRN